MSNVITTCARHLKLLAAPLCCYATSLPLPLRVPHRPGTKSDAVGHAPAVVNSSAACLPQACFLEFCLMPATECTPEGGFAHPGEPSPFRLSRTASKTPSRLLQPHRRLETRSLHYLQQDGDKGMELALANSARLVTSMLSNMPPWDSRGRVAACARPS